MRDFPEGITPQLDKEISVRRRSFSERPVNTSAEVTESSNYHDKNREKSVYSTMMAILGAMAQLLYRQSDERVMGSEQQFQVSSESVSETDSLYKQQRQCKEENIYYNVKSLLKDSHIESWLGIGPKRDGSTTNVILDGHFSRRVEKKLLNILQKSGRILDLGTELAKKVEEMRYDIESSDYQALVNAFSGKTSLKENSQKKRLKELLVRNRELRRELDRIKQDFLKEALDKLPSDVQGKQIEIPDVTKYFDRKLLVNSRQQVSDQETDGCASFPDGSNHRRKLDGESVRSQKYERDYYVRLLKDWRDLTKPLGNPGTVFAIYEISRSSSYSSSDSQDSLYKSQEKQKEFLFNYDYDFCVKGAARHYVQLSSLLEGMERKGLIDASGNGQESKEQSSAISTDQQNVNSEDSSYEIFKYQSMKNGLDKGLSQDAVGLQESIFAAIGNGEKNDPESVMKGLIVLVTEVRRRLVHAEANGDEGESAKNRGLLKDLMNILNDGAIAQLSTSSEVVSTIKQHERVVNADATEQDLLRTNRQTSKQFLADSVARCRYEFQVAEWNVGQAEQQVSPDLSDFEKKREICILAYLDALQQFQAEPEGKDAALLKEAPLCPLELPWVIDEKTPFFNAKTVDEEGQFYRSLAKKPPENRVGREAQAVFLHNIIDAVYKGALTGSQHEHERLSRLVLNQYNLRHGKDHPYKPDVLEKILQTYS